MTTVFDLVSTATLTEVFNAIGLGLVSFVWQGTVIGLVTAAILKTLNKASPQLRYLLACMALLLCFALPLHTVLASLLAERAALSAGDSLFEFDGAILTSAPISSTMLWVQAHLLQVVAVWATCVALFSIRLFGGLIWVARLSRKDGQNAFWQTRLTALSEKIGLKHTPRLRVAQDLNTPAVAGWLRPVVLVPASLISGMPPDLLEALLAHEVAHIRRMDYLVNLLQSAVEILLFYHPAVWFISHQIRIEREQIADDLAARLIGEPHRLALALNELEQFQSSQNQLALAANGGNLLARIKRLVQANENCNAPPIGLKATLAAMSLVLAGAAFYANAADTTNPTSVTSSDTTAVIDFKTCDKPDYPLTSLNNKEAGIVRMAFLVGTNGNITQSKITSSSGHTLLDQAALSALNKCKFKPATKGGKIISSWTKVDYVWKLPD